MVYRDRYLIRSPSHSKSLIQQPNPQSDVHLHLLFFRQARRSISQNNIGRILKIKFNTIASAHPVRKFLTAPSLYSPAAMSMITCTYQFRSASLAVAEGTVVNADDTFFQGGIGVDYAVAVFDVHGSVPVSRFSRTA